MFLGVQLSDMHILNLKGNLGADDFDRLGVSTVMMSEFHYKCDAFLVVSIVTICILLKLYFFSFLLLLKISALLRNAENDERKKLSSC